MSAEQKSGWELDEGDRWELILAAALSLSVEPIDGGLQWSALVEVPNGGDSIEYFATKEEAQKWCEKTATKLLLKDLKSLAVGEVTTAQESDDERFVMALSLEGTGSTLTLKPDSESLCSGVFKGVRHEWLWFMFWLPNEDEDGEELWVLLTFEEVRQLRDHLNELLSPDELPKLTRQAALLNRQPEQESP